MEDYKSRKSPQRKFFVFVFLEKNNADKLHNRNR